MTGTDAATDMKVPNTDMNVADMGTDTAMGTDTGTDMMTGTDAGPVDVCDGVVPVMGTPALTLQLIDNFSSPVHITAPPSDVNRIFVVERGGNIRVVENGTTLPTPFLTVSVACCSERGLLSMAFHPDYASNGFFYVNYTAPGSGMTVVSRWSVSPGNPNLADPASETVIITIPQFQPNHNGGQVAFDSDGYLWIGMGDGGGSNDPQDNGQDDTTLLGAMLRLDVDGGSPYAIPPGNPFAGNPLAVNGDCGMMPCPEIATIGVRNPWRFSFDRMTGDIYVGDVGQNAMEEVNAVSYPGLGLGGDYGWPDCEGTLGSCGGSIAPVATYPNPAEGCAVIGGFAYRGCLMPGHHGRYFYSDSCSPFLRTFVFNGSSATMSMDMTSVFGGMISSTSSFGEDAQGELYVANLSGAVYKIVPQ